MDLQQTFQGKSILVTGGLGFIGSNLAHRLVSLGANVLVADSLDPDFGGNWFNLKGIEDRVQVKIADLRSTGLVDEIIQGRDYLFNLAGQVSHLGSMQDPDTDLQINAGLQLAIVESCRKNNPGVKIVYTGSRQVYGTAQYLPVDELHPVNPVDFTGITKRVGELYHLVSHRVYDLRATSLRLTNTYGQRMRVKDRRQTFIGWWIHQLMEGQTIQVFGSGQQLRDLNYVDDAVDALLLAAASDITNGQIYNLGSGQPIRLYDLAQLMIEVHGQGQCELVSFPMEYRRIEIGDYYADFSKIRADLGWRPATSLRNGLVRTIAYYQENYHHYK